MGIETVKNQNDHWNQTKQPQRDDPEQTSRNEFDSDASQIQPPKQGMPVNPVGAKDSLAKRAGDALERIGDKIEHAGMKRVGDAIEKLGDRLEHSGDTEKKTS